MQRERESVCVCVAISESYLEQFAVNALTCRSVIRLDSRFLSFVFNRFPVLFPLHSCSSLQNQLCLNPTAFPCGLSLSNYTDAMQLTGYVDIIYRSTLESSQKYRVSTLPCVARCQRDICCFLIVGLCDDDGHFSRCIRSFLRTPWTAAI
ncbi:hypothetical protein QLX08_000843 [Tetragonisca angustula]|uniref:Uncharacterized protein n=1 Tax=Tetragonisca angustula TaxID=166442 RepID=A0AAW1AI45_9HYME